MKKALIIGLAAAVLTAALSLVAAGAAKRNNSDEGEALPAHAILNTVRAMGLNPNGDPVRRGPYYVLHAYDPRGLEVRVVADALFGEVLSVAPVNTFANAYAPQYQRGPRIIHVPQPGERDDRASVKDDAREPEAIGDDYDDAVARTQHRRVTKQAPVRKEIVPQPKNSGPRWKPRAAVAPTPPPPPAGPRRAVLSAPPPTPMGPTPIKPTPKFGAKDEANEKFGSPSEAGETPPGDSGQVDAAAAPPPPPGYRPPATVSRPD